MTDMMGTTLQVGQVVAFPDGNPRYGGLYIRAGVITKLTEKRATIDSVRLPDGDKRKSTAKTGAKLLVLVGYDLSGMLKDN